MWIVQQVLFCTVLTLLMTTGSAQAQIGPGFDFSEPQLQSKPQSQAQPPVMESEPEASAPVEPAMQAQALTNESKPLGLPRQRAPQSEQGTEQEAIGEGSMRTPLSLGSDFFRMVASLAGILLLIFAMASFYKRLSRSRGGLSGQIGAGGRAPAGIVEVLGRYPISTGMTLVVLRFDRKVLLLSHSGSGRSKRGGGLAGGGMQTLCELNSPEEVASILLKVREESGDTIAASFEKTLQEAGNATDKEIDAAMYQPTPGMHVQPPKRIAPGFVSNDEGDRYELTSMNESPAASQVLRRRLGAMRRGR